MQKKLHILFLCSWFPNRVFPTNGSFIQRHAEAVNTQQNVSIIHIITDQNTTQKIEIDSKHINGIPTHIAYLKPTSNPILKQIRYFKSFLLILKKIPEPINIVHLNVLYPFGILALYFKFILKIPYLISEHWSGYKPILNKEIGFAKKRIMQLITKKAAFVCPVSDQLGSTMRNFGLSGNYQPIPNVVDTSLFTVSKEKVNKFVITHISSLDDKCKNVTGILNVISKLQKTIPNLELNLIGKTKENTSIEAYKKKIRNINSIDHIPHKELVEYLNTSSVFVLFSNYENLPCVILESFSCGIPVISTNVGGISEYFPNNFGYLIDVKDELSLKKSILKIYNSQLTVNKEKMHSYVEDHFSPKTIATQFTNLYTQALEK